MLGVSSMWYVVYDTNGVVIVVRLVILTLKWENFIEVNYSNQKQIKLDLSLKFYKNEDFS